MSVILEHQPHAARAPAFPVQFQPDVLLSNADSYRTRVVAEATRDVREVFCDHRLQPADSGQTIEFCHRKAMLNQVSFNFIGYGTEVEVDVAQRDRDICILVVPLSGRALVKHLGQEVHLERGSYIAHDPKAPFRWTMSADHTHLAVGVPNSLLCGANGSAPIVYGPAEIEGQNVGMIEFLQYVCGELGRDMTPLRVPEVANSVEQTLIVMMRAALGSGQSSQHNRLLPPADVSRVVCAAETFMREHATQEITMADVVRHVGTSTSSLQRRFQGQRGVSPMRWLRMHRLALAREELQSSCELTNSVTDVMLRYCMGNSGRFAGEYRALFGELPSQTLKDWHTAGRTALS